MDRIAAGPLPKQSHPGTDLNGNFTHSKVVRTAAVIIGGTVPFLISWGTTTGLIFGGCCSNVGELEIPSLIPIMSPVC